MILGTRPTPDAASLFLIKHVVASREAHGALLRIRESLQVDLGESGIEFNLVERIELQL